MEVQMISTESTEGLQQQAASKSANLEGYISQYKGMSRYTRLLKIAEGGDGQNTRIEAILLCL